MGLNARNYRDHLYRIRSHPPSMPSDFVDQRDSFLTGYLSLIPFIILEYIAEVSYDVLPSGLVFPLGYLLFWAFYYTYYKPGLLEEKLTTPKKWDLNGIPAILLGVAIWFVKVTVVELTGILFGRWLLRHRAIRAARLEQMRREKQWQAPPRRPRSGPRPAAEGTRFHQTRPNPAAERAHLHHAEPPPARPRPLLPLDIVRALGTLGLGERSSWNEIHHRYRELAKQYHPDLNPEITQVGRHFIAIDSAYRRLASVRTKYFDEKRSG